MNLKEKMAKIYGCICTKYLMISVVAHTRASVSRAPVASYLSALLIYPTPASTQVCKMLKYSIN